MASQANENNSEDSAELDTRAYKLYGKLPAKRDLLQHQLKTRQYFDSGDFALSRENNASDIGAIKTGKEHPLRENISHPLSPVPNNSNVGKDANQDLVQAKSLCSAREISSYHGKIVAEEKEDVPDSLKGINAG